MSVLMAMIHMLIQQIIQKLNRTIQFRLYLQLIEQIQMLEERLLNTRKNLEKLAHETGKSLQDILKYLSQSDFPSSHETGILDCFANDQAQLDDQYKQSTSHNFEQQGSNKPFGVDSRNEKSIFKGQQQKISQKETFLDQSIQLIEQSILELNRTSTQIIENVVDLMVTKKIYKIRQSFRDLILSLLGLKELAFFACHQSGRIEYQDFSSNFITQILESDSKYSILQKTATTSSTRYEFINLTDNSDLVRLFDVNLDQSKGNYYGLIINQGSCQQESDISFCLMVKTNDKQLSNISEILTPKLINKIMEISQISTSQDSIYMISKIYTKKMLDLLQILIIQCEVRLKKALIKYCRLNNQLFYSVTNIVKIIISKIDEHYANQQISFMLRKLANQFEQMQYRKIQEIRMYKKYVRENNTILLEFSRVGILQFISGNNNNEYLNNLTRVWQEGKPVLDIIFGKNQKLDNYVKKFIRGSFKSERPLQIANDVKAKIITNGKKIQKIQIIIQDKENSTPSTSNYQSSQNLQKDNILKDKRVNDDLKHKTLKQIEKQNPGIMNEGWIDLFLKNQEKKPQKRQSSMSKKNNTFTINNEHSSSPRKTKIQRQRSYIKQKEEYKISLDDIVIDNPNLNFLTFEDEELDRFAIKVLDSLDYFQRMPQQRAKLQNFISQLHDQYQIHSNSFHNFRHGINVMHTCYLLSTMPANFNILTVKDIFVNVFSGLCHDVGHTGFTNAFQISSMSRKAMIYNDRSPLQNFHASLTFELLRKQNNNFLCNMEREQFATFRKAVIDNILYTDIKQHFPLLNSFNELLKSGKVLGRQDAPILSYMIVHSSDFAGSVKEFEICKQWSLRVNEQFANQYRVEGEIGIPQTPFMKDLSNPIILSKSQGAFLRVIVYPLYQSLDKFYITEGIAHKLKKNIEQNIKAWEEMNKLETQKAKTMEEEKPTQ